MRKSIFSAALVCLLVLVISLPWVTAARAEEKYSSRQINWYIHASAGGGTDIFSRMAVIRLRRILKVPIIISSIIGVDLEDIQKITRALARAGIHEIEPNNPIASMIKDRNTGDLKPESLGERVLSAIIEIQVKRDRLRPVLRAVKGVADKVGSIFCLDVYTMLEPGVKVPQEILDTIRAEGYSWRPNAKINMGLGRAWE